MTSADLVTSTILQETAGLDTGVRGGPEPEAITLETFGRRSRKPDPRATRSPPCRSTTAHPPPRTRPSGSPATSGSTPSPTRADEGQRMFVGPRCVSPPAPAPPGTPTPAARPCTSPKAFAWVQSRGEQITGRIVPRPDARRAHPVQEHWHGAAPDSFMEHLAMVDQADDPSTSTTWLEHVSDEEYLAPAAAHDLGGAPAPPGSGGATELDLASRRPDDSLSPCTATMWVARTRERSLRPLRHGPDSVWFRRALPPRPWSDRAAGVEHDVVFGQHVTAEDAVHPGDRRRLPREVRPVRPPRRRHRRGGGRGAGHPPARHRLTRHERGSSRLEQSPDHCRVMNGVRRTSLSIHVTLLVGAHLAPVW